VRPAHHPPDGGGRGARRPRRDRRPRPGGGPGLPRRAHLHRRPAGAAFPGPPRHGRGRARRRPPPGLRGRRAARRALRGAGPHRPERAVHHHVVVRGQRRARRRRAGRAPQPGGRVPGAHRTGAALMTPPAFPAGTFTPRPGPGSPRRMLAAQAATELRLALRHGEQVLLTVLIPVVLLVGLTLVPVVPLPEPRVAAVAPGVLALAVMSTAFTGQAIALGFDRRYGVLRRLAATAIPGWLLVAGRLVAVLGVVVAQ